MHQLLPLDGRIEAKSMIDHNLVIETSEEVLSPLVVRLHVIPNGGGVDVVDIHIRVFPSHFLVQTDLDALEFAEEQATEKKQLRIEVKRHRGEVLQAISNVFQGSVRQIGDDPQSFVICAKWTKIRYAVCGVAFRDDQLEFEVKTPNATLSESLAREIEMKLRRDL
jgi:hypothetical protein